MRDREGSGQGQEGKALAERRGRELYLCQESGCKGRRDRRKDSRGKTGPNWKGLRCF